MFDLQASIDSPLVNPAFIIENWGNAKVQLKLDGQEVGRGKDFRYGYRQAAAGNDLIIWLKLQADTAKNINISSAQK
jgi:hypothetical protein